MGEETFGELGRGEYLDGDEVESRLISPDERLEYGMGEGETRLGRVGDVARGVVEYDRWSSNSTVSLGVMGRGIPGT
jgi:hypothetical protein